MLVSVLLLLVPVLGCHGRCLRSSTVRPEQLLMMVLVVRVVIGGKGGGG